MSIGVAWIGEGSGPDRLIDSAVTALAREFGTSALRIRIDGPRPQTFDPARGQHSSRVLLAWLAEHIGDQGAGGPGGPGGRDREHAGVSHRPEPLAPWLPGPLDRILGITAVDLFIPVLTFVFGEAQLGGRAAVMSFARLTHAADPARLAARVVKEAIHEVGHTYGLVHCSTPACVMSRSPALGSVDLKHDRLCADCRVRYRELTERFHVPEQGSHPDR